MLDLMGFIPAHGESTADTSINQYSEKASPPYTGKQPVYDPACGTGGMASSPYTGKQRFPASDQWRASGIIPVHGEETRRSGAWESSSWHHPRTRGSNLGFFFSRLRPSASPPYTGKQLRRITPFTIRFWHHPRTRGSNHNQLSAIFNYAGITPVHGEETINRRVLPL